MIFYIQTEQLINADIDKVWDFFSNPENLNELTPPDLKFRIVSNIDRKMYQGQMIEYRVGILPGIWTKWLTEITHVRNKELFVDEQRIGPYKIWHHQHIFKEKENGVLMKDIVTYVVGYGFIGRIANLLFIKRKLKTIFDYRYKKVDEIFNQKKNPGLIMKLEHDI
jgi:ligand-binding SRPBCC domain-containing protein